MFGGSNIYCLFFIIINFEFQATVKEGSTGVIVNLTVEDRDDPATGAWRAVYTIINGNPGQSFEIHTNPENNEGMLSVVKVRRWPIAFRSLEHRWGGHTPLGCSSWLFAISLAFSPCVFGVTPFYSTRRLSKSLMEHAIG